MRELLESGELNARTLLWAEGMTEWQTAAQTGQFPPRPAPPRLKPVDPAERTATNTRRDRNPPPLDNDTQAFRVGPVFSQSWTLFRTRLGIWSLIGLIEVLATLLLLPGTDPTAMTVKLLIGAQVQAMIAYAAYQAWRGRDLNSAAPLSEGWKRFLSVLGIVALMVLVPAFGVCVLALLGLLLRATGLNSAITLGVAAAIFLPAAAIFAVRMFVSIPVSVVEKAPPLVNLKRGLHLTSGSFWRIFVLVLILLLPFVIFAAIAGAAVLLAFMSGAHSMTTLMNWATAFLTTSPVMLIYLPFQWLATAFAGILGITTYFELRREGQGLRFQPDRDKSGL
ncbi:MAG: DUF4339 domain-containing protein [Alphaproteobacteria bacterium]|nr:DUF4339 domain-containing protein [Alphaproteobacteria bacterium]